ncbi:type I toxin-antitoxin system Ibs family toxin, partial [Escherichia coli]
KILIIVVLLVISFPAY